MVLVLLVSIPTLAISALNVLGTAGVCPYVVVTSRGVLTSAAVDNVPSVANDIDAHGCDIGDYVVTSGTVVSYLNIHDANKYGIFVDSPATAITVTISHVAVYNIGNHDVTGNVTGNFAPNGVQTGIGIIFDSGASGPQLSGSITNSNIYAYQKNGIVINHNSNVTTTGNTVTGLGHVDYIAQNGIEYARDAIGVIRQNVVSGNYYTGNTGVLANGDPCGGAFPRCPPGRQYVAVGILLVLIDPNQIQRGQNDLNAPYPNDNQRNFAVITDSATD